VLHKLIIAVAAVLMLVIGVGAYVWREATALPDWYTEAGAAALDEYAAEDAADAPPPVWVPAIEQGDTPVEPSTVADPAVAREAPSKSASPERTRKRRHTARHELRGFHRRGHRQGHRQGKKSDGRSAVKVSRAIYEDGRLQAGVVVDLSRIPKDKLVARDRELYDRAVDQFPGITKRDVYIGIEDRPVSTDGVLQLGPAPEVRVGNLRYPLDAAARKIGMSPAELRAELDLELHRLGFVDPTHPG
jgi:hypothetical protein